MQPKIQYVVWYQSQVHKIPDGVDLLDATLAEPTAISLHMIEQAQMRLGSRVALANISEYGFCDIPYLFDNDQEIYDVFEEDFVMILAFAFDVSKLHARMLSGRIGSQLFEKKIA